MRAAALPHHVGVAEDDAHALHRHAQKIGYDLPEPRLVAFAARLRADADVHASLRAHADARLLVGHADRGFDVVRKPAAEELAPFRGRAATRIETFPVGDIHRPVHVLLVAPAVVGHADGVAVRHRSRIDEVLAAKLDAIDA